VRIDPRWFLTVALLASFSSNSLHAQLYTLQTKDLRLIYYTKLHEYVIPHLARCFENSYRYHKSRFRYTPDQEVTILLHDFADYGNAGATAVPRNFVNMGLAPLNYVYETAPANERMNSNMNHELVHIVASDQASSGDRLFRSIFFGKVAPTSENPLSMFYSYLTNPRRYSPRWYHEGIAVFMETWMGGGYGRALSPYDEMVFRTMVRDGSHIYDVVGLESEGTTIDFQVGANSYLYGTRFMSYLVYHYGPEKLIDWIARTDASNRYFSSQFTNVYGRSLDEEWSRWIGWEQEWQNANLASIREYPTTPFRPISRRALGSVSRTYYDSSSRMIYAAVNYPGQIPYIAAISMSDGSIRQLCEVKGAALYYVCALAFDKSHGRLFFTSDNNGWRDLNALNLRTGQVTLLQEDARTGDLAFNQSDLSLWGIRHFNGISSIVRILPPYNEIDLVHSWPYGTDMFDIDVSADGRYLVGAMADVTGRQQLVRLEIPKLLKGHAHYEVLFDFENSTPSNFAFSPDGRYLFGTSYYTGVSNVVRYDFERQEMKWISNCESGLFRPLPISPDSLVAFSYTGAGFVPGTIANSVTEDVSPTRYLGTAIVSRYPVLTSWEVAPPSEKIIDIDTLTLYAGEYHPLRNVRLVSAYPVAEGYKEFAAFGMRLGFSDPMLMHEFGLTASYTPNALVPEAERLHASLNYSVSNWKFVARYNGADFYDLFGPTKTSRKGYSLSINYKDHLIFREPETFDYNIFLAGYGGLERLPDYQNISTSFDRFLVGSARLQYKYMRASLGAVDYEKGIRWQLVGLNTYVRSSHFPRLYSVLDYGIPLPIDHSSIWLRSAAGSSFGDRNDPFANFYFGGFGNNWIDFQEIKRYREYYSFPGVELNDIGGKNFVRGMVEWNLPPVRFRKFGVPAFYSNWMRTSLFSSAIVTDVDAKTLRQSLLNVGVQVDFRLVLFSMLQSTFSLGYAVAFEEHSRPGSEFMISLKIL